MAKQRNDDIEPLLFASRSVWRAWLRKNHAASRGIWMLYCKGARAGECIRYDDAVEEALCWGWIDSIIRRVDDEKYLRKFTARRRGSRWSELNKKRIARMIESGQMTKFGLARVAAAKKNGDWEKGNVPVSGLSDLPAFLKALAASKKAKAYFDSLASSYKTQFIGWIASAKQDRTRQKRIRESIRLLEQNKKLGMK